MKKLTQEQFVEHFRSLLSTTFIEVRGETWTYDKKEQVWIYNEPFQAHCPECGNTGEVNIRDCSAYFAGGLITDPQNKTVHVDFANGEVDLCEAGYHCAKCDALFPYQHAEDFEAELNKIPEGE